MNILAIDTSSSVASVALMKDGNIVGEYSVNNGKTHSQIVVPLIEDMLNKTNMPIKAIDVFASSLGPGSFTGLRIGVATVKTFAQALDKKVVGISALDGLRANVLCNEDFIVCPIIDARRGNVYNALYNSKEKTVFDRLISLESVLEELGERKTIFLGDGIEKHRERIVSVMGDNAFFASPHISEQRASSIAYLANIRAENGDFDNIFSLSPIYVRASQAERELEGIAD